MSKKTYKKFSEQEIKKLKGWWTLSCEAYNELYDKLEALEKGMQKELGIPELEFFYGVGGITGIGTQYAPDGKKYELLEADVLGC